MTAPLSTDYPDYGRYEAQATKRYIYEPNHVFAGSESFGPFFVGDVKYIGCRISTGLQDSTVTVTWYLDEAMTQTLTYQDILCAGNSRFAETLPVIGPWVRITMSPSVVPLAASIYLWEAADAWRSNEPYDSDILLVSWNATNFNAGITALQVGRISPGPAILYVKNPAVAATVELFSGIIGGGVRTLAKVSGANAEAERRVYLPYASVCYQVNNPGPGAQPFTVILMADPHRR